MRSLKSAKRMRTRLVGVAALAVATNDTSSIATAPMILSIALCRVNFFIDESSLAD